MKLIDDTSNQSSDNVDTTQVEDTTSTSVPVSELVGEGKKFKNIDDLAKGKLEADRYIQELKTQIEELSAKVNGDVDREDYGKKVLEYLESRDAPKKEEPVVEQPNIDEIIERKLQEKEALSVADRNIREVERSLKEAYGDKYQEAVKAKAKDLGMTIDQVNRLAAESPQLVINSFVGSKPHAAPAPTVRTEALGLSGDRKNFEYYNKLRREGGLTLGLVKEMEEAAVRLGDDFYR